jgi:hypothetical protein
VADGLTEHETEIIETLGRAFNTFVVLPDQRPGDAVEFAHHIHILQRHVMARLARRLHPEIFGKPKFDPAGADLR